MVSKSILVKCYKINEFLFHGAVNQMQESSTEAKEVQFAGCTANSHEDVGGPGYDLPMKPNQDTKTSIYNIEVWP